MTTLTLSTSIRQHPDQITAVANGEVLMMHLESGNYYGFNKVASFIWSQLDTPRTIAELCAAVLAQFEIDEERCVADTLEFLQGIIDNGLVQVVDTGTGSPARAGSDPDHCVA